MHSRTSRPIARIAALALALSLAGRTLTAQTSVAGQASITIPSTLYISVANTSITFPTPTAADFNAGSVVATTQSLVDVSANVPHHVTVVANLSSLTSGHMSSASGEQNETKPISDLEFSPNGETWTPLATLPQVLVSGLPAGSSEGQAIQYRMLLHYDRDVPDTYTAYFLYAVVAD